MTIQKMSDGGLTLTGAEVRDLRHFLQAAASLHPVPGDDLGTVARHWLAATVPYMPGPRAVDDRALEHIAEWWETRDRPAAGRYTEETE